MKNTILAISFSALALNSCSKANCTEAPGPPSNNITYATKLQLDEFADDSTIVDYLFARQIAMVDMTTNKTFEQYGWGGCTLSSKPIIIYYFDNKPLYFDFIVLDGADMPRGSISVHARKTEVMQIAQVWQDVSQYGAIDTKSDSDIVFFADKSDNHRYIANRSLTRSSTFSGKDIQTGEIISGLTPMTDQDIVQLFHTEILQQTENQQSTDSIVESMTNRIAQWQKVADLFWKMAYENKDAIASFETTQTYTDNLERMFKNIIESANALDPGVQPDTEVESVPKPPTYKRVDLTLSQNYNKKLTWLKEFEKKSKTYGEGGFCGQWACAFIVGAYGYKYIPTDSILFEIGKGPMRVRDLNRVLGRYSNNYLGVYRTERSAWDVYWFLKQDKTPSFRLTTSHGQFHWTIIYGCYRVKRWITTNYYFLQIDNGSKIGKERYTRRHDNPIHYTSLRAIDYLYNIHD